MIRRLFRPLATLSVALVLTGLPAVAPAQEITGETEPVEESSGNPLYGLVGTAFLAAGAVFVICKTARR